MAYLNLDDEDQQQKTATGGVIAGSGGAAAQGPATTGSGFTNLQKYLSANKGSGGGVADDIISQGENAVSGARTQADEAARLWADTGVQKANSAAQEAAGKYQAGIDAYNTDPNDTEGVAASARGVTYGGPKAAADVDGYNDLEKGYQNVRTQAQNYAGDLNTQQAGLQKKYGYGSGFGALDAFLGRQDGKDKISGWAQNVNTGSAQPQVDRVNDAIKSGQKQVSDAQQNFSAAAAQAHKRRVSSPQVPITAAGTTGIASQTYQGDDTIPYAERAKGKSGRAY